MIKKLFTFLIFFFLTVETFAAGTSSSDKKPSYKNAVKIIEAAKKYESKNKIDKALKRYETAQKILLKLDKEKPLQADTLNYLGFTTRKLGDFEAGEKYYLLSSVLLPVPQLKENLHYLHVCKLNRFHKVFVFHCDN